MCYSFTSALKNANIMFNNILTVIIILITIGLSIANPKLIIAYIPTPANRVNMNPYIMNVNSFLLLLISSTLLLITSVYVLSSISKTSFIINNEYNAKVPYGQFAQFAHPFLLLVINYFFQLTRKKSG